MNRAFHAAWLIVVLAGSCSRWEPAPQSPPLPLRTTQGGVEMVELPGGSFSMGSPDGRPDESPAHQVWIDAFCMDRCEVTQQEFARLAVVDPSHFKGPGMPVEQVSWADAARYCNARSREEGLPPCYDEQTAACNFAAPGYRLPTEAEWEYACRAGSATVYHFGDDPRRLVQYAWCAENAGKKTHPVGQRQPNPWGLCDMYGNVAEWCNDTYAADYYAHSPERNPTGPREGERYVLRGGAWNSSAESCRTSYRIAEDPGFQDACFARDAIGFRCVRRLGPAPQ